MQPAIERADPGSAPAHPSAEARRRWCPPQRVQTCKSWVGSIRYWLDDRVRFRAGNPVRAGEANYIGFPDPGCPPKTSMGGHHASEDGHWSRSGTSSANCCQRSALFSTGQTRASNWPCGRQLLRRERLGSASGYPWCAHRFQTTCATRRGRASSLLLVLRIRSARVRTTGALATKNSFEQGCWSQSVM